MFHARALPTSAKAFFIFGILLLACRSQAAEPTAGKQENLPSNSSPKLFGNENTSREEPVPRGQKKLVANRFGLTILHPDSWEVRQKEVRERAFLMTFPLDHENEPPAFVQCEIGIAPGSLDDYQKRIEAREDNDRTLVSLAIQESKDDPQERRHRVLEANWSFTRPPFGTWFEVKRYVIAKGHLFTFTLTVDEGHYETYRNDLRILVDTAKFGDVDTGVIQVPEGYWMQREYHFGMKLPEEWKPAFRMNSDILLLATGPAQDVFTDNMIVTAHGREEIPFDKLVKEIPAQIEESRENTRVVRCEVVENNGQKSLETVIETRQGPFRFTILERRFQGKRLNYEVRFTLRSENFEKLEPKLKIAVDSFKEFPQPGKSNSI